RAGPGRATGPAGAGRGRAFWSCQHLATLAIVMTSRTELADDLTLFGHAGSSPSRRRALCLATFRQAHGSSPRPPNLASSTLGSAGWYSGPNGPRSGPSRSSAVRATTEKQPEVSARMFSWLAI